MLIYVPVRKHRTFNPEVTGKFLRQGECFSMTVESNVPLSDISCMIGSWSLAENLIIDG